MENKLLSIESSVLVFRNVSQIFSLLKSSVEHVDGAVYHPSKEFLFAAYKECGKEGADFIRENHLLTDKEISQRFGDVKT